MDERTKIAMEAYKMMYATEETLVEETEELSEGPLQDLGTTASYVLGGGAKGAEERRNKDLATAKRLGDIRAGRTPEGGMRSSDLGALRSALKQSYEPEGEMVDENRRMARDPEGRRSGHSKQPDPSKPGFTGIGNMSIDQIAKMSARIDKDKEKTKKEDVDIFDTILDYLVSEGYADTNENALVIMANMSEEWRQSIVEQAAYKTVGDPPQKIRDYNNDNKTQSQIDREKRMSDFANKRSRILLGI